MNTSPIIKLTAVSFRIRGRSLVQAFVMCLHVNGKAILPMHVYSDLMRMIDGTRGVTLTVG